MDSQVECLKRKHAWITPMEIVCINKIEFMRKTIV